MQHSQNLSTLEVLLLGPPAQQQSHAGMQVPDQHMLPSGSMCISVTAIIAWEQAFEAAALPRLCVLEMLGADDSQIFDLWEVRLGVSVSIMLAQTYALHASALTVQNWLLVLANSQS